MRYANLLFAFMSAPWAMEEDKLAVITSFLATQAAGEKFDAAEVEARISQKTEKGVARTEGAVAIIPVRGVIANRMNMLGAISGGTSSEQLGLQIEQALRSDDVKALLLDVDSPGGAVPGTPELFSQIYNARGRKPIVAHVNSLCASAAFWVASAADEIVLTPSGRIGSVGVFSVHDNVAKALERAGVEKTIISSKGADFKTEGNPFGPLTEEAKAHIQQVVDEAYSNFVKDLARGRGVNQAEVREKFGKGRTVSAEKAVALGMADSVATLEETLARFGASRHQLAKSRQATTRERALRLHERI